jgi:hypothetical protein
LKGAVESKRKAKVKEKRSEIGHGNKAVADGAVVALGGFARERAQSCSSAKAMAGEAAQQEKAMPRPPKRRYITSVLSTYAGAQTRPVAMGLLLHPVWTMAGGVGAHSGPLWGIKG